MSYVAFADGACALWTTQCGGYAAVVIPPGEGLADVDVAHECRTTSQRMELRAVLAAIRLVPEGEDVTIYTDSQYAVQGFAGAWALKKNIDLWALIDTAAAKRRVLMRHVSRDSEQGQIDVDHLAKGAVKRCPGDLTKAQEGAILRIDERGE